MSLRSRVAALERGSRSVGLRDLVLCDGPGESAEDAMARYLVERGMTAFSEPDKVAVVEFVNPSVAPGT